jgi:chromosome segregation ATPase
MTVDEGFKSARDIAKEVSNATAKILRNEFKASDTNITNSINTINTNLTNQIKAIPAAPAGLTADSIKTQISAAVKALPTQPPGLTSAQITDNIKTQVTSAIKTMPTQAPGLTSVTLENSINPLSTRITTLQNDLKKNTADFTTAQNNIKASETAVKTESTNITNLINSVKPDLANVKQATQQITANSGDAITKITGYVSAAEKSVAANKQVSAEIDVKAKNIGAQIDSVKKYVDQAKQYNDDIDKKIAEFQKSSALILAQMQLLSDNFKGKTLGVSGFQNMKKDSDFSQIDTAYNGQLQLEGFSTVADSAYLNSSDLFALERNVVLALKEFNEAYYAYRKCLHDTPTISSSRCATELTNLTSKKDAVITVVNAFNVASAAMKAKMASTSTSTDNGKRITQAEFEKRHEDIKTTAQTVSELRSELDMKMANLLDKSKGPFPEAKNKYNAENYVTIGWSILATSVLYYVFVEMK